jgi:hypothetical protein
MKIIKLYTFWRNGKLECCCPPQNECNKDRGCELIKFNYDEYEGINDCMRARKYKRNSRGCIEQY